MLTEPADNEPLEDLSCEDLSISMRSVPGTLICAVICFGLTLILFGVYVMKYNVRKPKIVFDCILCVTCLDTLP